MRDNAKYNSPLKSAPKGDKTVGSFYESKNYEKFKQMTNRTVSQSHIAKIARNMKNTGWLGAPIVVNDKFQIVDGQHRYYAAIMANIPVRYIFDRKDYTPEMIAEMNSIQKKWSNIDYLTMQCNSGNENYIRYKALYDEFVPKRYVKNNVILSAISRNLTTGVSQNCLRNGTLQLSEEHFLEVREELHYLERCYKLLDDIGKSQHRTFGRNDYFGVAILFMLDNGADPDILYHALESRLVDYTPATTVEQALKQLENIYNYRKQSSKKLYFMSLYEQYRCMKREQSHARSTAANTEDTPAEEKQK